MLSGLNARYFAAYNEIKEIRNDIYNATDQLWAAGSCLSDGDVEGAGGYLKNASGMFNDAADHIHSGIVGSAYKLYDTFNFIDINWPEAGGEITWKSIVEAWIKDDFEGRFWTIAVIDRMRQLIWNEPFEISWAARPEDRI